MGPAGFEPATNGYLRPFADSLISKGFFCFHPSHEVKAFSACGLKASALLLSAEIRCSTMLSIPEL